MATDYKFEGWMGKDASSVDGKMVWQGYEPKPFDDTDIDIKISHCGVSIFESHPTTVLLSSSRYVIADSRLPDLRLRHPHAPQRLGTEQLSSLRRARDCR